MAGMSQERFNAISNYLRTGRVIAYLETGDVIFPNSRNSKLTRSVNVHGYKIASIKFPDGTYKPVGIHQIIAIAGGLNPVWMTIDHINGNKLDNRFCNLRILSGSENAKAAWHEQELSTVENRARNESSGKTNFSNRMVALMKYCMDCGGKVTTIAKIVGCSHSRISEIKSGKTWKEINYNNEEEVQPWESLF